MIACRLLFTLTFVAALACAAETGDAVSQAANRVEQQAGKAPQALALEFRMRAAQSLQQRRPDLARKFVDATLDELRVGKDLAISSNLIMLLAAAAPADTAAIVPKISPKDIPTVIAGLARADQMDAALALYRLSFSHGQVRFTAAAPLLKPLAKDRPSEAAKLFQEILAAFSFDPLAPSDAWWLINSASAVAPAAKELAADAYERILAAASLQGYGNASPMTATFQIGSATITTTNARDTLLLAAGSRLRALAPERLEKYKSALAQWDLSEPATIKSFSTRPAVASKPSSGDASGPASIIQRLRQMRGLPTDADRSRLAVTLAGEIRALPAGAEKLGLATSLCGLATEGDLGRDALTTVATTLGQAIRETPASAFEYLELANLVRYEHLPAAISDPAFDTAIALLALREQLLQEAGFTLTALDGKTYNLDALRGRVVLLNFWATWCPPCRKEMPDMEKLYQRFEKKGLTVLAVSDEERETVAGFLQKQNYTFPVLLDPGRKVHSAFNVEGIPKSFIFDREGKLAAQAIDMRTEHQFLELLKRAGLE